MLHGVKYGTGTAEQNFVWGDGELEIIMQYFTYFPGEFQNKSVLKYNCFNIVFGKK